MLNRKTTTRRLRCSAGLHPRIWLVFAAAVLIASCAGPEQPLIDQFFAASRLRDRTALQKIATVVFEPHERGIVTTFSVVGVAERREGSIEWKDVTIAAPVALPDGRTEQKTLIVTLTHDESGRWLVTSVADPGSRP